MTKRFLKIGVSAITLASISLLMCGCNSNKGPFKYEGKIYKDSYNYKNDYGYKYLLKTNEKVAKFYENIYLQMVEFDHKKQDVEEDDCHTLFFEGSIIDSTYTYDDMYQGYSYLTAANPQFFWMGYTLDEETGYVALGISRKYAKTSERTKFEKKLNKELKKIDKLVDKKKDAYDKIKTISDYIMDNMTYARDETGQPSQEHWAHSITGFFDRNEGVCESYAKAFKLLCDRYDIGNIPVTSEDHIWNLIEYDNEWYVYDLTYDDDYRNTYVGQTEEVYNDPSHIYHRDLFELPENMTKTPLSLGKIELKENGETIYSSHSMNAIMSKLNGSDYEIVMNTLSGELSTAYYIRSIGENYKSLKITSNQSDEKGEYVVLDLASDITLTNSITLTNFTFQSKNRKTVTLNNFTVYLKDITLSSSVKVEGDTIVYLD